MAVALSLAFVWADTPWAQTAQGRVIYMATIEPRGGAQQDKEPFPQTPLPAGDGYRKTPPGTDPMGGLSSQSGCASWYG